MFLLLLLMLTEKFPSDMILMGCPGTDDMLGTTVGQLITGLNINTYLVNNRLRQFFGINIFSCDSNYKQLNLINEIVINSHILLLLCITRFILWGLTTNDQISFKTNSIFEKRFVFKLHFLLLFFVVDDEEAVCILHLE